MYDEGADEIFRPLTRKCIREEYDQWHYHYPEYDTSNHWVKMPSPDFSDAMVKAFEKQPEQDGSERQKNKKRPCRL